MAQSQVLIVGAGPTGLVAALCLTRQGINVRIVEKNDGPGQASRAMVVQARTLEFYRQLGFAEEIIAHGIEVECLHLREGHHDAAIFNIGDFGEGISPYPFVLSFPQDEHERFLVEKLTELGVQVEWGTELGEFREEGSSVRAVLHKDGNEEVVKVDYMLGCDGARSTVRKGLIIGFSGGTYNQIFYVADVAASGEVTNRDFNMCLSAKGFCAVLPIRTTGMFRLIGVVPEEFQAREDLDFEMVKSYVEELVGITVEQVNWSSIYHVHHRVADRFRSGRIFLAGDAGHIHSPAGGQGMNTGIGDAVNLSWKIAQVLKGHIAPDILETYDPERLTFAHSLVASTDRAFQLMVGKDTKSHLFRDLLIPHLAPFVLGFSGVRKAAFRLLSQTRISYRESPLSDGAAGDIHGGDRLPWVNGEHPDSTLYDNFEPLRSRDWQIHVYGVASDELKQTAIAHPLPLFEFAWSTAAEKAGIHRDALYLVRPDGYIALVQDHPDIAQLKDFLTTWEIHLTPPAPVNEDSEATNEAPGV